ncbi:MAG: TldD/PmbA family protein [Deltaproteobacteria bacterium]|nr:TldD/PmbA family protein [Deltaproteobacteria bacterium]
MSQKLKTPINFFEGTLGTDDGLYRRVLEAALMHGGDHADLYFQQRTSQSIALEDHEVRRASLGEDLGVGVRVVHGDATGLAFCESLDEKALIEAARVASGIARGGSPRAPRPFEDVALESRYALLRGWEEVSTEERLPLLESLDTSISAQDPRIIKVSVSLRDSANHVMIVDAEGRKAYDYRPMVVCSASCVVEHEGRREENSTSISGREGIESFDEARLHEMADRLVARTLVLLEAERPPPGELPVVLAAGAAGILLHEAIGHGMEADFNRKGTSIYSDAVGEAIAPAFVSVVDDGTQEGLRGALNVDDEGYPAQRTVLVEDGILRGYLHDVISARHYGLAPTGNGRRQSFRHLPLPRMRSTYMLPGPHAAEEIIRSVKRGIYAQSFTNGQVRIGAGDFTFYIKNGYLIEDGKLTAPIKEANIIGNGPEVLRDVKMVGDDLLMDQGGWTCGKDGQSVPVTVGMPTVKLGGVTVGGVG